MKQIFTLAALLSSAALFAQTPSICMVTVDGGTNYNMVAWDKAAFPAASYNIYQETSPGNYSSIGNVATGSLSVFFDINSDPDAGSSSYKITTIDGGSNESAQSAAHTTMFLNASVGGSGEVNLSWSHYAGFNFTSYTIWRGATTSTMTAIDSIPASLSSYVDISPLTGSSCYKIEVRNLLGCTPTSPATDYSSGYSNTTCASITSIDGHSGDVIKVGVAPNPFSTSTTVSVESKELNLEIELYNMIGKKVKGLQFVNGTVEVSRDNLPSGIYLYRISTEGKLLHTDKLIIQ